MRSRQETHRAPPVFRPNAEVPPVLTGLQRSGQWPSFGCQGYHTHSPQDVQTDPRSNMSELHERCSAREGDNITSRNATWVHSLSRPPSLPKLRTTQSSSSLRERKLSMESPNTLSPSTPLDYSSDAADAFFDSYEANVGQNCHTDSDTRSDTFKSKFSTVFDEANYFLGGLIKPSAQNNKHFTILRHSHGLVYYKGPTTSVTLTVLSDKPLPPDRRYWLQSKGWIGNTGMKLETLCRATSGWIEVTPSRRIEAVELPRSDERSWQRDIKTFTKRPPKSSRAHVVRETVILRIPAEAADGYVRAVLTTADKRNVLCPSPVFRVASTSLSASSIKGASLTTLPVELGLNIIQFAATQTASKIVDPWIASARKGASKIAPASAQTYARKAYAATNAQDQLNAINQQYSARRKQLAGQDPATQDLYVAVHRPEVVGCSAGPEAPFPIHFKGTIVRGSGRGFHETGMPTSNLAITAQSSLSTLFGVYFGWARVTPRDPTQAELHTDWRHAIVTITYDHHGKVSVAAPKVARAYLLHNYGGQDFSQSKMSLIIMGYLRPTIQHSDTDAFFSETLRDIEVTRASLERTQWGPEHTHRSIKKAKSERNLFDRCVDARMVAQQHIDSIPLHKLGIRSDSVGINDRLMHGNGGLFICRDGS